MRIYIYIYIIITISFIISHHYICSCFKSRKMAFSQCFSSVFPVLAIFLLTNPTLSEAQSTQDLIDRVYVSPDGRVRFLQQDYVGLTAIYSNRPGNKIKTQATPMIISCFSWRTQLTLQRRVLIWHARVLMVWWSRPSRLACNILTGKIMLVCLKVEHDIPRTQANCEARSFEHTANSKSFGW